MSLVVVAITALIFGTALLAMSVGVMAGRAPIQGSCGGVAGRCAVCTRTCEKRGGDATSTAEETP